MSPAPCPACHYQACLYCWPVPGPACPAGYYKDTQYSSERSWESRARTRVVVRTPARTYDSYESYDFYIRERKVLRLVNFLICLPFLASLLDDVLGICFDAEASVTPKKMPAAVESDGHQRDQPRPVGTRKERHLVARV